MPLLIASGRYLLDRLKGICEETIRTSITRANVASILVAAHRHEATGLKEICLEYIVERMDTVKETLTTLKQEPDLLYEIIMKQSERQQAAAANKEAKKEDKKRKKARRRRSRERERRRSEHEEDEDEDNGGNDDEMST